MVRTSLIVEVEDESGACNSTALRGQILSNLAEADRAGHVEDIEFRVVPLAPGPQRARSSTGRPAIVRRGRAHRRSRPAPHLSRGAQKGTGVKITEQEVRYVADLANLQA